MNSLPIPMGVAKAATARDVLLDRQVISDAKQATALVVLPSNEGFGSAFCVDRSGYFVTNTHVVEGVSSGKTVSLVLHAETPKQKVLEAKVVHLAPKWDLALLKTVDTQTDLKALTLRKEDTIADQTTVTALGFPYGDTFKVEGSEYPSVSVNIARINRSNMQNLGKSSFEFSAQVNPGNSGGPVIDETGNVVGVVFATKLGTGKGYAIPLVHLRQFLFSPKLELTLPRSTFASRYDEALFQANVTTLIRPSEGLQLELKLKPERGEERTYPMIRVDDTDSFQVRAPLVPRDSIASLNATFRFLDKPISGIIKDQKFQVDDNSYWLSDMPSDLFVDGSHEFNIPPFAIKSGDDELSVDCREALGASLQRIEPSRVEYTIIVRREGREIASEGGEFKFNNVPSLAVKEYAFTKPLQVAWNSLEADDHPPTKSNVREVPLFTPISDVASGETGKCLTLHAKLAQRILLFDVGKKRLRHVIRTTGEELLMAASKHKLVLIYPDSGRIERWDLSTGKRDATTTVPSDRLVKSVALGGAGDGPILLHGASRIDSTPIWTCIDLASLRELELDKPLPTVDSSEAISIYASASGEVFGGPACAFTINGTKVTSIELQLESIAKYPNYIDSVIPSADGKRLFYRGFSFSSTGGFIGRGRHAYPAYDPRYAIQNPDGGNRVMICNFMDGNINPVIRLTPRKENPNRNEVGFLAFQKRHHLYADLKLLVSLSNTNDSLVFEEMPYWKQD
ncbi:MAG: serine protease [Pirellulaceae bacterium]